MIGNFPRLLFVPCLLAILAAGCTSSSTPTVISGKVTYKGGPVTGGVIYFGAADQGAAYQGYIKEDGSYTVSDVPQGEMVCWIDMEAINPEPPGKPKNMPGGYGQSGQDENAMLKQFQKAGVAPADAGAKVGKYMKIPVQYTDKKKSTLKVTAKGGKQTANFELTD